MTATPTATRHKAFSLSRVFAIASNTLLELIRLKVFYFLLLFALVVIGFTFFYRDVFQEEFQSLKDVSLGAMWIFTLLLSILPTAMLLPKDIEDRTLYTILAKPVPRFEYLLGKFLGVLLLLFIAVSLMTAVFLVVLYSREKIALAEAVHTTPPKLLDDELTRIKSSSFTESLLPGIVVVYLKGAVCASLTLLLSTFASSMIFTIIVSVVIQIIGHVQPIARDYFLSGVSVSSFARIWLALVSLLIPDLTAFSLVDDMVAGNAISLDLFAKTAALGGIYVAVYFFVAYFVFSGKEL
jgi:ABC-2 type transport system permease protein